MAYLHQNEKNGKIYELHYKDVTLKCGYISRVYFFAAEGATVGTPCDLPEGYEVKQSRGLLHLRKVVA